MADLHVRGVSRRTGARYVAGGAHSRAYPNAGPESKTQCMKHPEYGVLLCDGRCVPSRLNVFMFQNVARANADHFIL